MHLLVEVPTKLDDAQAALLKQLAALRSEEGARIGADNHEATGGIFSRLKDAFSQR